MNGSDAGLPSCYRERRAAVPHPFVACWWEQRVGDDRDGYVQRVVPDACADVIVSSAGTAYVVGPATSVQLPRLAGGERLRGLRLRTAAIGAALGLPARDLRDLQVPLAELFPRREAARIADDVRGGRLPSVLDTGARDRRVEHAVGRLLRPASRVAAVADDLGISERHLRRLVADHAGLEPSTLQRVARFQRFLALSDGGGREAGLAELAGRTGYADQAHLSREVRALAGLTPSALLAERRRNVPLGEETAR
ncbi:helix-turn-helix domain-containing protein [Actinoallomurus iriomotensis]|uniref:AraC family transcriptional regulator n=1 Tax=Actinoallomurus iriomotensis TaxID=478107 RepID=A0A9W6VPT4_9ACTN|nr:AraC family transcriptional regulator [Actinoallomurus iriomotensis]GLY76025.1 AraC family transcriptional regulator [Actinoallomurus iriomotensis]